ncbi:MAG TPA: carboxypeptidase-like regulatory domain-containing protein [Planctomycetota bacterium]
MKFPLLTSALFLLFLASAPHAQVITGRVVSASGAGVPGVNIDGFDIDDNEIDLANDGTDAAGFFTTTVVSGPGVYRFVFYPPPPPASTHLVGERPNVVVVTTTNLGTVTLGAGVLLTGRTVRTGNVPVANVFLEVIDETTGNVVLQDNDKTSAFGTFALAIPPHACELRLDTTSSAFVLGSRFFELDPTGPVALGDIFLPPGAVVSGQVRRPNGLPVDGVDLDFDKASNGNRVFVPDDNTDVLGNFSVVVALNTYDLSLCPDDATGLAGARLDGLSITGPTSLGILTLPVGLRLSGTVVDQRGAPAAGVDVDVFDASTGAALPLCNDNTNAAGAYSVRVPAGTYDVVFTPGAAGAAAGGDWHRGVVLAADTVLNGTLPPNGRGNSSAGPPPSGGTIPLPLVTGGPGPRPRAGRAPSLALSAALELVVEEIRPGAPAFLLLRMPGGASAIRLLAPADATGRVREPIGLLPEGTWLRVLQPGTGRASGLHRLQHRGDGG